MKEKILELANKIKQPPNWLWKLLGGLLLLVIALRIRNALEKRGREVAALKADAVKWRLDSEKAVVDAQRETNVQRRMVAEVVAEESLKLAKRKQEEIAQLEEEQKKNLQLLQAAIEKDWTKLNKLAVVVP